MRIRKGEIGRKKKIGRYGEGARFMTENKRQNRSNEDY